MHTAAHPATIAPVNPNLELTLGGIRQIAELIHGIVGAKVPHHVLSLFDGLRIAFYLLGRSCLCLLSKARLHGLHLLRRSLRESLCEGQLKSEPFLSVL